MRILLTIVLTLALSACGSNDTTGENAAATTANTNSPTPASTATGTGTTSATTTAVSIASGASTRGNAAFGTNPLIVTAGATVTWTNSDTVPHTVTADDGSFDSGNLAPGATYSHTFNTADSYPYYCQIHPTMRGTVQVNASGTTSTTPSGSPSPSASPIPGATASPAASPSGASGTSGTTGTTVY